jgi:hypothetical protein
LAATGLVTGAFATPAQANQPPTRFVVNDCIDDAFFAAKFCFESRIISHVTESKSGNVIVIFNAQTKLTVTQNGVTTFTSDQTQHDNLVIQDGEVQVAHFRATGTTSGQTFTCSGRLTFTFTNGELRHEDTDFNCTMN